MKVYDGIILFNEIELLELRLMTLYNVVDRFIVVEAGTSFTGKKKELSFEENKKMFEPYMDKITYIKEDALPYTDAWQNEYHQRNLIAKGLTDAKFEDYIIVSDADEIPNPEALIKGIINGYNLFGMAQKLFYYYVNCLQQQVWYGSTICKIRHFRSPQDVRNKRTSRGFIMRNGGWHYSFLGGVEKIQLKLSSFAEQQVNTTDVSNEGNIKYCLDTGEDLFHRTDPTFKKKFVPLESIGHAELETWLKKYPDFIKR